MQTTGIDMRSRLTVLAAGLAAGIVLAACGTGGGGTGGPASTATVAFASIDETGRLLTGHGVVSVEKAGPGDYRVRLDRNIEQCAPVATVRDTEPPLHGLISTYKPATDTVRVGTFDRAGEHVDGHGFHLVVACPPG